MKCETCLHNEICRFNSIPTFGMVNVACQYEAHELSGEWIRYTEEGFDYAKCSACKWDSGEAFEYALDRFHFCPNCGADMRGEEK